MSLVGIVAVASVLWFAPTSMEATARHALAIGVFMVGCWAARALDAAVAGLIGCYLFWALGVVPFPVAFGGFVDSSTWFILGAILIGTMASRTPLPRRLAFATLRITGASYSRVLLGLILVVLVLTLVVPSGVARVVVLAPIAIGLVEAFDLDRGSRVGRGLFVAMIYASTLFDKMILGGVAAITARSAMEQSGFVTVLWSRWAIACAPAVCMTVVITWWLATRLFPPERPAITGGRAHLREQLHAIGPWSPDEKRVALLLALAFVLWSTDFLHHLSPAVVGLGIGLAAFLPGIGTLDAGDLRSLNIVPVIFVGCAISMGTALGAAGALADATALLAKVVAPWLHDLRTGSLVLYGAACLYHLLLGNEVAMMATTMPSIMQMARTHALDPFAVGLIWTLGAGGKLFLYQSAVLIVGHSYGYFDRRDLFRIGWRLTLAGAGVVFLLSAIYWPLVGIGVKDAGILPTVQVQIARFPAMQVEDAYKLVHQAAFGNGHLITDEAADREYLQSEFDSVSADANEPLTESLTPDGSVVRVNLRAFKARGGNLRALGDAMLESATRLKPRPELFDRWWQEVVDAAARGDIPFDAAALRSFGVARKTENYPAIHHSAEYTSRYRPAYRVVLKALLPPI